MFRFNVLLLFSIAVSAFAQDKPEQAVQKPNKEWLALVDNANYADSWNQAADSFRAQVTKEQWTEAITNVRKQTGKLKSRELKSATYTETLPGAPPGKYVVSEYNASFDSGPALETVVAMQQKAGEWRVGGYFVKPSQ